MTLFKLTQLPPNVAGRQRVVESDISWIFGIFLRYSAIDSYPFQGTQLTEAKALRPRVSLNFPTAFISYCTTKKIKWLIFLLM